MRARHRAGSAVARGSEDFVAAMRWSRVEILVSAGAQTEKLEVCEGRLPKACRRIKSVRTVRRMEPSR